MHSTNRDRLLALIGENDLIIVPSATMTTRNDDVEFPFRQDSTFRWLTGFDEPDAIAVLAPGHHDGAYQLFVNPRDPDAEAWTGYRAGTEGAKERFGADEAYEVGTFSSKLKSLVHGRERLWYSLGGRLDDTIIKTVTEMRQFGDRWGVPVVELADVAGPVGELRLRKTPAEMELMARAAELSGDAHIRATEVAAPGVHEYQVQAEMEALWFGAGATDNGYPPIVASGPNACILHYVENRRLMEDGDLLLIDAACEVDGYGADITRTFPINGVFSAPQRAIYDVVLTAEVAGIEKAVPGNTFKDINEAAIGVVTEGLVDLGLIPGPVDRALSMHHYRTFLFHGIGHWLGLDVHDSGRYRLNGDHRPLEEGMVFTVEPGIYVADDKGEITLEMREYDIDAEMKSRMLGEKVEKPDDIEEITHQVPEEFLGIGVRIEDDIAITPDGHRNLSKSVPV
ncbi:MAG: M24 family metallopeptidase [Acidimicrobiia bacterium]|nr:M24 family metallopeptidase [Acidimicrobiia bacterium]